MSKLHLVFGGRVKDPQGLEFDLDSIDLVGLYGSYADAENAWSSKARSVAFWPSMRTAEVQQRLKELAKTTLGRSRVPKI